MGRREKNADGDGAKDRSDIAAKAPDRPDEATDRPNDAQTRTILVLRYPPNGMKKDRQRTSDGGNPYEENENE